MNSKAVMLSVQSEPLEIGQVATMRAHANRAIRYDRLIVPSSLSANFAILDVSINDVTAFAAEGAIPAAAFDEQSLARIDLDDLAPGAAISISVRRVFARSPNWLVLAVRRWLWLDNSAFGSKKKELAFSAAFLGATLE